MSNLEYILKGLQAGFDFLRRDGLFVKATAVSDDEALLENTTYVTDTDEGRDIDCLYVHEDDLGLGGTCVCEDITTGEWLKDGSEAPKGCVACPVCNRLTRPWTLKKRCYSVRVKIHEEHISILNSQPDANHRPMPAEMSKKIINICNAIFPVTTYS
jgi:hypothetical protein